MSYDTKCWELAEYFGHDELTDNEIAKLSQHIQTEIESEIEYLKTVRKEPYGPTDDTR